MKQLILILGFSLLIAGCGEQGASDQSLESVESPRGEKLAFHSFHDKQWGMVAVQLPLPADWQVMEDGGNGNPSVTGPNGVKVIDFPAEGFVYTNDPAAQQMHRQNGTRVRLMPGIDELIQQDIVPWARDQGLEFVRQYEIEEITRVDEWYNQQLYKVFPVQAQNAAIGTEWKTQNGDPFFFLMHLAVQTGDGLQTWYYYANGLHAEPEYFEEAKQQLIFGLANARYNPQYIQAYNQSEAQKAGQSWAAHQQRMATNQANFEASQRAIVSSNNAVNDAIMGSWRERNASQDRSQNQYINSITEQNTMIDPSTGQTYQVDSGANNYWMNRDGEYISTDNYNYNPNTDQNVNQQDWQQMEDYQE